MMKRAILSGQRPARATPGRNPDGDEILDRLRRRGLKITRQRRVLSRVFRAMDHMTAGELHEAVLREDPSVGRITAYRFLKVLCRLGLARERHFSDGLSRFDNVIAKTHHDHLICDRCGRIVEFSCEKIETMQREIAHSRGFLIRGHRLEVRGLCRECRAGDEAGGRTRRSGGTP